jgi:hypothetical protein
MNKIKFTDYEPHEAQQAFHYYMNYYRFVALISGIRAGKTYGGAREATQQAWNAKGKGVYGIIAPTYNMLDRTTWMEFKEAAAPLIASENSSKKIITLKDGRRIHGHSADRADRIRNETFVGFWVDEARECKNFANLWNVLMGRVLSTGGRGFVTTSPNGYDDIHDIFINNAKKDYGVIQFPTYANTFLKTDLINQLEENYDEKFASQELHGEFVVFQGSVYYTFNRTKNAGDLAHEVANYDPNLPICLCCDFNVDPMAWVLVQIHIVNGMKQIYVIDEIYIRDSNTVETCREFKTRYPNHNAGLVLYGDATGRSRSTNSNVTNWMIIKDELGRYGVSNKVPRSNPAERDRVNAVNGMMCNSKGNRRVQVNPKCKKLIADFEQVGFKEGTTQIDKTKNRMLTHPSDSFGYLVEYEFSLNRQKVVEGLKI